MQSLPPYLQQAIEEKRLLIFAGAGMSMLPPSSLPNWRGFNEALLKKIKACAGDSVSIDKKALDAIDFLSIDNIGVKLFSESIVKIISGEGYFPVLQVLDSELTNANHQSIAELAGMGVVKAIVTTNFDTLLERAFDELSIPRNTFLKDPQGADNIEKDACNLYKIHGSVDKVSSLVDTVGQKLRGLQPAFRKLLAELFRQYHVLVIGYSGEDLSFGSDYLSFESISPDGPGITWLVKPGSQPSPLVTNVLKKAGDRGSLFEASLPEFFELLGATKSSVCLPVPESKQAAAITQNVTDQLNKLVKFGQLSSLAFCMRMLLSAGKSNEAKTLRDILIKHVEEQPKQNNELITPAIRALAVTSELSGKNELEYWTLKELDHYKIKHDNWLLTNKEVVEKLSMPQNKMDDVMLPYPFEGKFTVADWKWVNEAMQEDIYRLQAGATANLAVHYVKTGDIKKAGEILQDCLGFCELSADRISLASLFQVYGSWWGHDIVDADFSVNYLMMGYVVGIVSGNIDAAISSLLYRANLLILLAEYDNAIDNIQRAQKLFGLNTELYVKVDSDILVAMIQVRTAKFESAFKTFQKAIETAGADPLLKARVQSTMIMELYFVNDLDLKLTEACDAVLSAMHKRDIPSDGQIPGLASVSELEELKRSIKNRTTEKPYFLIEAEKDSDETETTLRRRLTIAEFYGAVEDKKILLKELAAKMLEEQRYERCIEVARASRSLHNEDEQGADINSLYIEAMAYSHMGVPHKSIELLSLIEQDMDGMMEVEIASVYRRLALSFWTLGDTRSAVKNLDQAHIWFSLGGDFSTASRQVELLDKITNGEPAPLLFSQANTFVADLLDDRVVAPKSARELHSIGESAFQQNNFVVARIMIFSAMETYRLEKDQESLAQCYELLAWAAKEEKRFDHANLLLAKAERLKEI